ncbi:MAG: glycosyltransferase [Chloroflexi bacterium]|nr:glycosyltransferase [Chloroflexota bacterium]
MRILFLSRWFPYPMNNGSKIRIYNLLRGLSQHHEVTLLSFADQAGVSPEAPEIRAVCSKVQVIPWREFDPATLRARLGFFSLKPRSVVDTFSPEMATAITQALTAEKFDLVIASQLQMAAYAPYFRGLPAVFEEFEIGLFHDQAFSADGKIRLRRALTWFKLRLYLSRLLSRFRLVVMASERERELLARNSPQYRGRVEVIPNCLNVEEYPQVGVEKRANTLIFSGPFKYRVNYEAMTWFVGEVFPLILAQVPDTQLIITGDHENLPLPSLRNVTLSGYVDDIKSLIASCAVSVAPLLSGGGTRLKILEAMALGTPVVATSKGAEGLEARAGEHLLVADEAGEFAKCVIKTLQDESLRLRLAESAHRLVCEKYNWGSVLPVYLRLLEAAL